MAADTSSMGALRSKINLSLHTYHATKAWWGRNAESGKPPIIGMRQFLFLAGAVQRNVTRDDPYADYWMLLIDEKLADVRAKLDAAMADAEALLEQIPSELAIEENVNQQPFTTPVYTGGQQGWLALRLLIDFDRLARNILLATHVALMTRKDSIRFLDAVNHEIRSLCAFPQRYPGYSGVTRDDFAANNAKAREAREKFGELPDDVLKGTRRSPYAPEIQKPHQTAATPGPATESEDKSLDVAEPTEGEEPANGGW
ncbi:PFL_4669 family integrating conjugative element protein [Billgrantia ethanolica]|uniref:TIGR03761 family integrating conjugative element protein n=1 Tax=Billgrantia ethanolica TaxID=2733486 RepID=A0ABS9ABW4_9GAMM|nr:TIGR03761 family integrating conjugative element protein [Halomonas ethanolica]MCE8005319.1 TIGR03761 family integrating conjugative element protein [Halomonas ethanolica]